MLGLRRPHQSPHRRARQIGDVLAGQRDRAAGRHHQVPAPVRANQDCTTGSTACVAAYTSATTIIGDRCRFEHPADRSASASSDADPQPPAQTDTGCTAVDG